MKNRTNRRALLYDDDQSMDEETENYIQENLGLENDDDSDDDDGED